MDNKALMVKSDLIQDILTMLLDCQNAGKATVFMEVSGHVQQLAVRIFAPIWTSNAEPTFSDSVYLDYGEDCPEEDVLRNLRRFKSNLNIHIGTL